MATSKYYLISIYREDVFLLITSTGETQPLLAIEFLHRVFDIFEEYFGTVEESTVKENFATVFPFAYFYLYPMGWWYGAETVFRPDVTKTQKPEKP